MHSRSLTDSNRYNLSYQTLQLRSTHGTDAKDVLTAVLIRGMRMNSSGGDTHFLPHGNTPQDS